MIAFQAQVQQARAVDLQTGVKGSIWEVFGNVLHGGTGHGTVPFQLDTPEYSSAWGDA